ncbi:MAG TPA: hypothetical protein VFU12_20700 [Glycomyces sp.]|nr:hypothetical protein [Glycomyces sp.]
MSIDDFASAISAAVNQTDQLAAAIGLAKSAGDDLSGRFAGLGADGKAGQVTAVTQRLEAEAAVQAAQLQSTLEALRAQAEALRGSGLQGAPGSTSGARPASPPLSKTRPSLPPDQSRAPGGSPTFISPGSSGEGQENHQAENDAAVVLARHGYPVEQNPPTRTNGKNPDYRIEGNYWDCYAIRTDNIEQVRKAIRRKVKPKDGNVQAERIVLSFDASAPGGPSTITPEEIESLLQRKPVTGLKEVKVVKDGRVHDLELGG